MKGLETKYEEIVITLSSMYAAEEMFGERQLVLERSHHDVFTAYSEDGKEYDILFDRLPEQLATGTIYSFKMTEDVVDPSGTVPPADGEVIVFAHGITDIAAIPESNNDE